MTVKLPRLLEAVKPSPNARPRDPLGRKPGEVLDPAKFTKEQALLRKEMTPPRTWYAMWQQTPIVEGGNLLGRQHFLDKNRRRVLSVDEFEIQTDGLKWVRFWDFAYTVKARGKGSPDFTVGAKVAFKFDEWMQYFQIYVRDMVRLQGNWTDVKSRVRQVAAQDGIECYIGGEGNGPQKAAVEDLRADPFLLNYVVWPVPAQLSKTDRAELWMSRARDGMMWLCEGDWTKAFYDEIEAFPNGPHDDTVDGLSGAYAMSAQRSVEYSPKVVSAGIDLQFNPRW